MAITVAKLHPLFCAEIGGVDAGEPMTAKQPRRYELAAE